MFGLIAEHVEHVSWEGAVYVIFQMFRGGVDNVVAAITGRFVWIGTLAPVAQATVTLAVIWYFCYWLYQRKIFFKL